MYIYFHFSFDEFITMPSISSKAHNSISSKSHDLQSSPLFCMTFKTSISRAFRYHPSSLSMPFSFHGLHGMQCQNIIICKCGTKNPTTNTCIHYWSTSSIASYRVPSHISYWQAWRFLDFHTWTFRPSVATFRQSLPMTFSFHSAYVMSRHVQSINVLFWVSHQYTTRSEVSGGMLGIVTKNVLWSMYGNIVQQYEAFVFILLDITWDTVIYSDSLH